MKTNNKPVLLICAAALVLAAIACATRPGAVRAQSLPPRPTVVPIDNNARPTIVPVAAVPQSPQGARITLSTAAAASARGLRAVVQWQGGDGRWYDVEGWRSTLNDSGVEWWVAPREFGKGPFRWAAYRSENTQPAFASAAFMMPKVHGQSLLVTW